MHRRFRLGLAAAVVSALGALAPAAAASAAPGWSIPSPFSSPSPGPQQPGGHEGSGLVTFRGFPAGTTIAGSLGATWQNCAAADNARTFSSRESSSLTAALTRSSTAACSAEPAQSVWLLTVTSPAKDAGGVVFTLSQNRAGGSYDLTCGPSQGAVTCQAGTGSRHLDVVPQAAPAGRPGHGIAPAAGKASARVTFRGFPGGGPLIGGLGTIWTTCVTGNNGRSFIAGPGSALTATITTSQAGPCAAAPSRSIWELYVSGPPAAAGAVVFTLGQSAAGRPFALTCGGGQGRLRCVVAGSGQVYIEPVS
jgi:hypothetical protein